MRAPSCLSALFCFGLLAPMALAQDQVLPAYSIWDVVLGQPVTQAPDASVGEITCGTNGGPPGRELGSFSDYMTCTPEESGLREVQFSYDDEQDYIARALELEYKALQGGTSVYAHPVIVSVLVDPEGIVQGRRIVTDDRTEDMVRRTAFTLIRNFKGRFGEWALDCRDVPMRDGEQPVGNQFIHELCTARSPDDTTSVMLEATYLRKRGQQARNLETQEINTGYFQSQTRFEEVLSPYVLSVAP
ncbi:hypothetical protein [Flavimaricola marinus]|uniref:Uncharacterized protein n=1 Tax=Flavimaricola marinus TaxID=1819565 RepID=A0A238LBP5_9RHOB|nr:hypothetical protein [Flavimaricola marinus]SMY06983.1 hypothetical protein LOM8899_01113 [Flavimaricola marinus]